MKIHKLLLIIALILASITNISAQEWEQFNAPKVELIIEAKGHPGVESYLNLVNKQGYKNIEDWLQHCALVVAQELYYTVEQANAIKLDSITYKLNDGGALSYKDGAAPHIEIGFDLNYLMSFIDKHDMNTAAKELYGVLCHEIAHGYQQEPKNAGAYQNETEFFGFIEGTADLTRLKTGGFHPPRTPKLGGNYKSGYNITAFFYLWITRTKDEDFLKKLNNSAKLMEIWTLKKAIFQLYGASVDVWWQYYQKDIDLYPWIEYKPSTCAIFTFNDHLKFEGDVIAFRNYSRLADEYIWTINHKEVCTNEHGDMAWVFPKKGNYYIQLLAKNSETGEENTLSTEIVVLGKYDDFEFSKLQSITSSQYNDSPKGEGLEQLFDGNLNTKFLSFQKETWVQIEMKESYVLSSYSLTSANDQVNRDPKNWILMASQNGEDFIDIANQDDFQFTKRNQKVEFKIENNKPFKYFRLQMEYHNTDDYGKDIIQLTDWVLNGHLSR